MKRIILAFSFVMVALGLSHHALAQCTGTPITNFALTNTVNVSCNGGNDGQIQVTFTGGEPPFSYSLVVVTGSGDIPIDNISNTTDHVVTFNGLYSSAAYSGQYKVTVVTSNGGSPLALCKTRTIQNIDISEPSVLNLNTTGDIVLACNGDTDGTATFTATGGTAPYTFAVDANTTGGTTSTTGTTLNLIGAGPGAITVTVTDANNCTNQASVNVTQPTALSMVNTGDIGLACQGETSGTGTFTVSGGTAPYVFTVDTNTTGAMTTDAATALNFTGAGAGTITVTATDASGCTGQSTVTITQPAIPNPIAPAVTFTPDTYCVGETITPPAVTSPIAGSTYTWYSDAGLTTVLTVGTTPSNAQLGFSSVAVNTTTVYVAETNSNSCTGPAAPVVLTVNATPLPPGVTFNPSTYCVGDAITPPVITTPVGGSTYTWYSDAGLTTVLTTGTTPTNAQLGFNSATVNTTTVYVTETNASACPGLATPVTITINAVPVPPTVNFTPSTYCVGDVITPPVIATPTGGSTYTWYSDAGLTTVLTTGITPSLAQLGFSSTTANTTTVYVRETTGSSCSGPATPVTLTVNAAPTVAPVVTFIPSTYCVGDGIIAPFVTTPVAGSTYTWYSDAGLTNVLTTGTTPTNAQLGFSTATANTTTVYVRETNASNCPGPETPVTITVNPAPVPTITGPSQVCINSTGNVYTTEAGMTGYVWTVNGGIITNGTGTNAITVTWTSATAPTVSVNYTSAMGCPAAAPTTQAIVVNPEPVPTITGPTPVCINSIGNVYTTEAGMTGYVWTVNGGTITAGTGTNEITVTWTSATSPSVSVNYTSAAGCTAPAPTTQAIVVNPEPVPTITGPTPVCMNSTGNIYTTEAGMTGYIWTVNGGTITAGTGTNEITVTWTSATSPSVSVNYTSASGCAAATPTVETIVVNPEPVPTITGPTPVCINSTGNVYTTEAGMTGYVWTVNGGTITAGIGTNEITVTWTSVTSPSVSVNYTSAMGCPAAAPTTQAIVVNPEPVPTITGPTPVCINSIGNVYTTEAGMTGYVWTVNGGTITAGTGTNEITVTWTSATSPSVSVNYTSAAGCTAPVPTTQAIVVNPEPVPTITGPTPVCINSTGNIYTTEAGMTGYVWTVNGGTITAGTGTNEITVTWTSATSPSVSVNYTSASGCAAATPTVETIVVNPEPVPTITGPTPVCINTTGNVYTTEAGMTGYVWTVNGGTITAGTGTNEITVTWTSVTSPSVSVTYTNAAGCTAPVPTTQPVVVNTELIPTITGPSPVCINSTGNVYTTEPGMTGYVWTVNGGTITAGTGSNSITVTWTDATAPSVSVNYTNASGCPAATPTTEVITVEPEPVPTITGPSPVCINTTGNVYTTEAGMTSYVWTVNGGTITAGAGTNAITVTWTDATAPSVSVNYTSGAGCTAAAPTTQVIVVNPEPIPTITGPSPVCINATGNVYTTEAGMTGYVWTVTGGAITAGTGTNEITVTWTSATAPSVSVNYTSAGGCTAATPTTQAIVVNPEPIPTITGPATACINSIGNIYTTEVGMTGYVWTVNGGTITAGAGTNEITVTWTSTTTTAVTVNYTTADGCTAATPASLPIVVNPEPVPTITGPSPVCINSTGHVYTTEAGMTGYVWTISDGTITAGDGTNSITVTWTGTTSPALSVTYVDAAGCTPSVPVSQTVIVNPEPDATITPAGPFCTNSTAVTLTAITTGGTWSGPGITDPAAGTFDPSVAGAGTKTITYEITVGGCTATSTININVFAAPDATINAAGPFCTTDGTVTLTTASAGGTWSGTGITDAVLGSFDPANAGPGLHTITYSLTVGTCTDTKTIDIAVATPPDASITPAGPFCTGDAGVTLVAATAGGTWSGTGITDPATGTFDPATAGTGTHTITYSIIIGGCSDTETTAIVVNPGADATITPAGPYCLTDAAINLVAASAGGTWSGIGITDAALGTFDPGTAGVGDHVITYAIATGACNDTNTITITVGDQPDATITPAGPLCTVDGAITLTAVTPGGTWSGAGITDVDAGTFDPATAGPGTHTITYTIIIGGCTDTNTIDIVVNETPDASITLAGPFCVTDGIATLTAATPGGVWSGTGVNPVTGEFDPATAGIGDFTITYTIAGVCPGVDDILISVANPPDATITPAGPLCTADGGITLTAVTPGGTWSGAGITDVDAGTFDPATAGPGTHTITYEITIGGCSDTQTTDIVVNESPDATITLAGPFCVTDGITTLTAATPGGVWSGTGVNPATGEFDPATAGVGTFTITYTIAGPCPGTNDILITVANPPDATITPVGSLCASDAAITLVAITPGGVWSGSGITDAAAGTFDPTTSGAGTHTITYSITIGGCSDTETIDITVNPSADPSITPVGPFCANGTATTLNAATAGGTWSGPGITDAATGAFDPVAAGPGLHVVTYSVTVGGCTSTDTENILVRNPTDPACGGGGGTGCLAFTRFEVINFTRPSCNLQSDGAITIRVEGGTPNYIVGLVGEDLTQQLFGPGPEFTFTNLSPDEGYKYNVTDGAGNFCELNYSLRVEPNVQATASDFQDALCMDGYGKAIITVTSGGSAPFEYSDGTAWIEFISGNPIDLPSNGTYNILVRDDASDLCPATIPVTINTVNPPIDFEINNLIHVTSCNGTDGGFTVANINGGGGAYQIRLLQETILGPVIVRDFENVASNSFVYEDLTNGSYIIVIQDLNGCAVSSSHVVITAPGAINFGVAKLRDSDCGSDNQAKSGAIEVQFTAGGNYQIGISKSQFLEPAKYETLAYNIGDPFPIADTLSRGTYFVFVKPTSGNDCPSIRTIAIEGAYALSFGLQRVCNPVGAAGLNLTDVIADPAGSDITVNIYASNDLSAPIEPVLLLPYNSVMAIDHIVLESPGEYFIEIVQTQAMCRISSAKMLYTVGPPMSLVINKIVASLPEPRQTGAFTLETIIGGLPLSGEDGLYYDANLVDPITNAVIDGPFPIVRNAQGNYERKFRNVPIGTYRLEVTDAYGCEVNTVVIVPKTTEIIIPNVFTPNDDLVNDLFEIVNLPETGKHKMVVTNRWGKEMFASNDYREGTFWDAEDAPEGIYYYRLQVDGGKTFSGWVEIIKGSKP